MENKIVKVLKKGNIKKSKIDWDSMPTVVIGGDINNIKIMSSRVYYSQNIQKHFLENLSTLRKELE